MKKLTPFSAVLALTTSCTAIAQNHDLLSVQQRWAATYYQTEDANAQLSELKALLTSLQRQLDAHPQDTETRTWLAIVQASAAKAKGGLGALDYAKAARANFEKVVETAPETLDGTALSSLGALYHKVPGWPVSFGDDDKAETLFKHALQVNPRGIDQNYFYAEYLYDEGEYKQAAKFIEQAKGAPARPDRPVADKGRHAAITTLAEKIAKKLS